MSRYGQEYRGQGGGSQRAGYEAPCRVGKTTLTEGLIQRKASEVAPAAHEPPQTFAPQKLEVGSVDDPAEAEADSIADRLRDNLAARTAAAGEVGYPDSISALLVQKKEKKIQRKTRVVLPGWPKVKCVTSPLFDFTAHALVNSGHTVAAQTIPLDNLVVKADIQANTSGVLCIAGNGHYVLPGFAGPGGCATERPVEGNLTFRTNWSYTCSPEGELKIADPASQLSNDNQDANIGSCPEANDHSISHLFSFSTLQRDDQRIGVSKGPLSVGVPLPDDRSDSVARRSDIRLQVNLNVVGAQPKKQTPSVTNITNVTNVLQGKDPLPAFRRHMRVYFESEGSSVLTHQSGDDLLKWMDSLPGPVLHSFGNGRLSVRIRGCASTPGERDFNDSLSEKRAKGVEMLVRRAVGSGAIVVVVPLGERTAQSPGPVREERHVDIDILE